MKYILSGVIAYLLGSLNCSIVMSKLIYHDDVRKHGSGNAGATNFLRLYGKKTAAVVFAIDFLKGFAATYIGGLMTGEQGQYIAAFFVVLGHIFPIYFGFKGGKGVSTAAGSILALNFPVLLIIVAVFLVTVVCTRYVSLGSILASCAYAPATWFMSGRINETIAALILSLLVIFMHRGNIKRLLEGNENKLGHRVD